MQLTEKTVVVVDTSELDVELLDDGELLVDELVVDVELDDVLVESSAPATVVVEELLDEVVGEVLLVVEEVLLVVDDALVEVVFGFGPSKA